MFLSLTGRVDLRGVATGCNHGLHKGSTRGSARSNGSAFDLSSEAVSIGLARALTRGRRLWGALAFDLDVSEEDVQADVVDAFHGVAAAAMSS